MDLNKSEALQNISDFGQAQDAAPAAAMVTVDTPEFRDLVLSVHIGYSRDCETRIKRLIAHIDALIAQAREEGNTQGWAECEADMKPEYDALRQRAEKAEAAAPQQHATAARGRYADSLVLAKAFHEAYERLAPQVGYETRMKSREFDSESANGRLMIAVCAEIKGSLQPQQHAQAALSDHVIKAVAIDYAAHVAGDVYDVTKYDCAEDFFNCVRAIIASQQPAAAPGGRAEVDKMLETNQLDELGAEVARLQTALCFWLPSVTDREDDVAERILQDAFLLCGIDGNIPDDFKTAQELGWISLTVPHTPPQEAAARDERADFEAWFDNTDSRANAWDAWKARAALADKKIEL